MFRCERIETALRDRVWSIPKHTQTRRWNGLFLQGGNAIVEDRETRSELDPSMLLLAPADRTLSMRVLAGSEGLLFTFDQQRAARISGYGVDSDAILQLLESRVLVRLDQQDVSAVEVEFALQLVMRSAGKHAPGQETLLDGMLKLVLVALLRNLPESFAPARSLDRSSHLLQRFRHLLENNFRDRWQVARYAEELGISSDRLHDLCVQKQGKSPSALVAERSNYEAKLLLRNSAATVEEIAGRLGYRDPSHFSRKFSNQNGESPRAFRKRLSEQSRHEVNTVEDFADWP